MDIYNLKFPMSIIEMNTSVHNIISDIITFINKNSIKSKAILQSNIPVHTTALHRILKSNSLHKKDFYLSLF